MRAQPSSSRGIGASTPTRTILLQWGPPTPCAVGAHAVARARIPHTQCESPAVLSGLLHRRRSAHPFPPLPSPIWRAPAPPACWQPRPRGRRRCPPVLAGNGAPHCRRTASYWPRAAPIAGTQQHLPPLLPWHCPPLTARRAAQAPCARGLPRRGPMYAHARARPIVANRPACGGPPSAGLTRGPAWTRGERARLPLRPPPSPLGPGLALLPRHA